MSTTIRLFGVCAFLLLAAAIPAEAKQPTQVEWQFIHAVQEGQIDKARALLQLAPINPDNIAGKPIISMVTLSVGQVHALSDATWSYLLDDLHQNLNSPFWDQPRSMFATLCVGMHVDANGNPNEAIFNRTLMRIGAALKNGASAKENPNAAPSDRQSQPIWACLNEYRAVANDPRFAGPMLKLIDTLLQRGADPNYTGFFGAGAGTVTTEAIAMMDGKLLRLMVSHGGRIGRIFPVTAPNFTCRAPKAFNTGLFFLPDPSDRDVDRARAFLETAIDLGADINARETKMWMAGRCQSAENTLKERALNLGQIEYARMALRLEKEPRTAANATKLPDASQSEGGTAKAVPPETGFVTPDTTITEPNALSPEADQQLREMVYTMFGGETSQPFTLKSVYHAPNGQVGEITTTRAKPIFEGACKLKLDLATHSEFPLVARQSDTNLSIKVDFTKATGYRVLYTPEPFSTQGSPNSQIRNPNYTPRNIANVSIYGDGAMCIVGRSPGAGCSTAAMGKTSRNFSNLSVDAQQRAFAALKKRCPSPPASTASLPQITGGDMVYALYGFSDFKRHTHSYVVKKPDGSPLTTLTETFKPTVVDACHLRVAYTRREKTGGKPFIGSYDTTYLYDFTKLADINVDIIANPDLGVARLVGGTLKGARPVVVSTTAVGAGAKCELGAKTRKCNQANEYAFDIHDPAVTPPLLRKAFEAAKARCNGP